MESRELLAIIQWVGGLSFTGFVALSGWLFIGLKGAHCRIDDLSKDVKEAVQLEKNISKISLSIEKIEIAILGSYDKPYEGIVHKVKDLDTRIKTLEKIN